MDDIKCLDLLNKMLKVNVYWIEGKCIKMFFYE